MRYRVTEGFNSLTRRFVPGMEIDEAEIDGSVLAERWAEMGKIAAVEAVEPGLDPVAEQERLRLVWDDERHQKDDRVNRVGWPIRISDQALFGTVTANDPAVPQVEVTVPGEPARLYPRVAVDFVAASVAGDVIAPPEAPPPLQDRFRARNQSPGIAEPVVTPEVTDAPVAREIP